MTTSPTAQPVRRWWSFGHVWMVIAGPAIVVVAGFVTFYLAVRSPDPVLTESVTASQGAAQGQTNSLAPAIQARNHAATAAAPATDKQK